MPKQEEWDALVATVANQQVMLAEIFERLNALWLGLATGDVVPEITISEENIEADSVTANKINVGTLSAIAANMGVLTAGEIDMYTGTWDSDATGFRLTASEICGQNAGTDQVLIAASTGKLTAGAGAVVLGADGITIDEGDVTQSWIKWVDSGGSVRARIYGYGTAETEDAKLYLIMQDSTGSPAGHIQLDQATSRAILSGLGLRFNDANTEIWEDASSNLSFKDANAGTKTLTQLASTSSGAVASGDLTLTTSAQDIAGATLSLGAGTWLVFGVFDFEGDNNGAVAIGVCDVGGADETPLALLRPDGTNSTRATVAQVWPITLSSTTTVKLQAYKSVNVGTFTARQTHTTITAVRTGD